MLSTLNTWRVYNYVFDLVCLSRPDQWYYERKKVNLPVFPHFRDAKMSIPKCFLPFNCQVVINNDPRGVT